MAAPNRQKKSGKSGKKGSSSVATSNIGALLDDIDRAPSWHVAIDILCSWFKLPDLTTRSGLKKVHGNFEVMHKRIDAVYCAHKDNDWLATGIIGIYTKMCTDSILRDKLFGKDLVGQVIPLLTNPDTVKFASLSMSIITHHGGMNARLLIAVHIPLLVSALADNLNEPRVVGNLVATLGHCLGSLLSDEIPNLRLFKKLEPHLPALVETIFKVLRDPSADRETLNHSMVLLSFLPLHCHNLCKKYPAVINFLISGLRSSSLTNRSTCMTAVIRYHRHEAEEEPRFFDPRILMAKLSANEVAPPHISALSREYGLMRCENYLIIKANIENQRAFTRCAEDHDLYRLGVFLVDWIWQSEYGAAGGVLQEQDESGRWVEADVGLPFPKFVDALPHCAAAIRARKLPAETWEDMADILEIKHLISSARPEDAVEFAKRSVTRNPHCAYFYYAITLTGDSEVGLRAAKKGLKCVNGGSGKKTSPFVKFQMMRLAVGHAGDKGFHALQMALYDGDKTWNQATAFLMCALDDARTYIKESPPDNRHRLEVLCWVILLTFLLDGPAVSQDMSEIKPYLTQLSYADDFSNYVGIRPPWTNLRLAQQTIVSRYVDGCKEWGHVFKRLDSLSSECDRNKVKEDDDRRSLQEKAADELAAWVEKGSDTGELEMKPETTPCAHPAANVNSVELYRCSWCRNPSAALRKCSGCGKTRYCDSGCQKAHWTDSHKKSCKPHG